MRPRSREFMEAVDSVLHGASEPSSPAVIIRGDLYLNLLLGLAFQRPENWHFNDVREIGEIGAGQQLRDDTTLESFFSKGDLMPLVSMSEVSLHDEGPPAFAPAVSVFAHQVTDQNRDPLEVARLGNAGMMVVMPRYVTCDAPGHRMLSGWPAALYTAGFEFRHAELPAPVPVRMHALFILHDRAAYTFRMYDAPEDGRSREGEFRALRESIRLG